MRWDICIDINVFCFWWLGKLGSKIIIKVKLFGKKDLA